MKKVLETDLTIFDEQLFFYFRNKYKPQITQYLEEKHYFEIQNNLDENTKRHTLYIWNGLLIKEIVKLGFSYEHLANQYDLLYQKIAKASGLAELQNVELHIFSKYIDIIINQQESTDHLMVNKILHYLHLHIESNFTLHSLTQALKISQSHASRIFKEHMDDTIIHYSKYLKIERAKALLKSSASVTEIGELLGFYDQSHFYRTFKSLVGVSPKVYKTRMILSK